MTWKPGSMSPLSVYQANIATFTLARTPQANLIVLTLEQQNHQRSHAE